MVEGITKSYLHMINKVMMLLKEEGIFTITESYLNVTNTYVWKITYVYEMTDLPTTLFNTFDTEVDAINCMNEHYPNFTYLRPAAFIALIQNFNPYIIDIFDK